MSTNQGEQVNILLATPCYGNQLLRGYFHSVLRLQELTKSLGIGLDISTIGNESLITRARNYFVSLMLCETKYTHLLFVDSDITFDPASVVRMVQADKDVVAGCYPKKSINWDKIKELLKNPSINAEFVEPMSHDYALNVLTQKESGNVSVPIVNGFMKVSYVATGFLLVKRKVLTDMVARFPETKYANDVGGYNHGKNEDFFYALFDCLIDPVSKRYLSEDYAFSQRWLGMGGDIWVDLMCNLNHTGSYEFRGSYYRIIEHLLQQQGVQLPTASSSSLPPQQPSLPPTVQASSSTEKEKLENIISKIKSKKLVS